MFDQNKYRCQGTVFDPFHSLDAPGESQGLGEDGGFIVDVLDLGDIYLLEAELPGYTRDELDISVDGACLSISAEKPGRDGSAVHRRFDVSGVNVEQITGKFHGDILTIELPKKQ